VVKATKAVAALKPAAPETTKVPKAPRAKREVEIVDDTPRAPRHRDIAVSEFFSKNRHLLGFDSPHKALLTAVREAVDNALDACEEARLLPDVRIELTELPDARFRVRVEDNGPGIPKAELGKIFARLLYGSKFHRLKQSRGQQGIGISAAVMYAQMTTGEPAVVTSKQPGGKAQRIRLFIDTAKNAPKIERSDVDDGELWAAKSSGTSIELWMSATYKGGRHGVEAYVRQTALANPHARFVVQMTRLGKSTTTLELPRIVDTLPIEPKEIKPHPHGLELGTLQRMLQDAGNTGLSSFLVRSFSRVTTSIADAVCSAAKLSQAAMCGKLSRAQAEDVFKALQAQKLMAPPTSCLSPIGEAAIVRGLYALTAHAGRDDDDALSEGAVDAASALAMPEVEHDEEGAPVVAEGENVFVTAVTRPPSVYRGNPFQVECGILYSKSLPADELARVFRFANRVPLLYQGSACAMTKSIVLAPWRSYEVQQARGAPPTGPLVILIHIASAWVPYTSESKEAIAHYPEVLKELRLAILEVGRRLQRFLRRRRRDADEAKKRDYITRYLGPIGEALQEILHLDDKATAHAVAELQVVLERSRTAGKA
jgi:DNA topoisomerase-6 subunit B